MVPAAASAASSLHACVSAAMKSSTMRLMSTLHIIACCSCTEWPDKLGNASGSALATLVTAAFPHHPWDVGSLDCQWNAVAVAVGSSRPAQSGQRHGSLDES